MARPNDERKGRKKNAGGDQEQEEVAELETKEPERDRRQDQLGNQAVAAMIASGAAGAPDGGGGGGGAGLSVRKQDDEKEGVDYGGDDDAAPVDVNFDEALLAEAWRPRTKKSEDKPRFLEQMPDEDLPPADEEWLAAIRRAPNPKLVSRAAIEALVQPTAEVVATSLADWARGAFGWGPQPLIWRALRRCVVPSAPGTSDPHGRVLPGRARAGALGMAALVASPTLTRNPDPATSALMLFDLELQARRQRMVAHASAASEIFEGGLPVATVLFAQRGPSHGERRSPAEPSAAAILVIESTLTAMVDFTDPMGMIPALKDPEEEEEDDPLGIQAIIEAHTGGAAPPPHRAAAVKAAERMAEQSATTRVQLGAAAAVIAEVADLWTTGPPRGALTAALHELDGEVDQILALLVEIARAAQTGAVKPIGLVRGMRRAAKGLARLRATAVKAMARAAASSLPPDARVVPPNDPPQDVLSEAWADGRPMDAVPWIESRLTGWEREAVSTMTRLSAGQLGLAAQLSALCDDAPGPWRPRIEVLRDAAFLHEGQPDRVDASTRQAWALGRRNGVALAEAAVTTMEARVAMDQLASAEALRAQVGAQLYHLGGYAGLSLLARWTPAELDEDDG